MTETIASYEDLMKMLDSLLREPEAFWDEFYQDRSKPVPIFADTPDENLKAYIKEGILTPGRALDLGCGAGRNAIFLAEHGFEVDAVDLSQSSLDWARERARERNLPINFIHKNIFNLDLEEGAYDLIYDSGCFHHIAPHRRMSYLEILDKALKHGGYFGITCFVQGGKLGGADISDWEVYRTRSLMGGLGFTEEKLIRIFSSLKPVEVRRMRDVSKGEGLLGVSDLLAGLFLKR
ncbi:class I SAM-dependent methyltransferase [Fictibacillus aquaticus]|uniref:SAM-dependent methyltransferase n=1 Tax=Fictibacillus aquaticus TaxID=2021314 RepID=A0A235FEH3_9BACL|nr:methyltransferase domain-containing protein [Fictibacillus aquaticus]OYD59344.1 SAM-dependent methyltransferase [Fictibacillus aquaticus]